MRLHRSQIILLIIMTGLIVADVSLVFYAALLYGRLGGTFLAVVGGVLTLFSFASLAFGKQVIDFYRESLSESRQRILLLGAPAAVLVILLFLVGPFPFRANLADQQLREGRIALSTSDAADAETAYDAAFELGADVPSAIENILREAINAPTSAEQVDVKQVANLLLKYANSGTASASHERVRGGHPRFNRGRSAGRQPQKDCRAGYSCPGKCRRTCQRVQRDGTRRAGIKSA